MLNAAALRYVQAQDMEKCDQVLKVMAEKDSGGTDSFCLHLIESMIFEIKEVSDHDHGYRRRRFATGLKFRGHR